jgi:enterochelin esterase family protein
LPGHLLVQHLIMDIDTYERLGLCRTLWDRPVDFSVNGRSNMEIMAALDTVADRRYLPCPEAGEPAPAPAGAVSRFDDWRSVEAYPGTTRELWVYVPTAGLGNQAPGVIVFQDGGAYLDPAGPVRATAVLDWMIRAGELPPMVGVFINPGRPVGLAPAEAPANLDAQRQRSVEYDSCTETYVRFLLGEVLPFVEAEIGTPLSADPTRRLIVGISSGGICAFNAAWHAPLGFGRVLSHCGSFTNIRGGHNLSYLVRTTPRKPIRVFLQSGEGDADILYGNWPIANKDMAAALAFAGYEMRFEFGEGGHSLRHGGAVFSESLRWLLA